MCANVCVCLFAKHLRWLYDFIDFLFIHEMWIRWNEALSKHLTSLCSSFSSDFDWFAKQNIHISTTSTVYTIYIEKKSSLSTFVVFIYFFFFVSMLKKTFNIYFCQNIWSSFLLSNFVVMGACVWKEICYNSSSTSSVSSINGYKYIHFPYLSWQIIPGGCKNLCSRNK